MIASARIVKPNTDPPSSEFAGLKRLIEEQVPQGARRDDALQRIATLDPKNLDEETDKAVSAAWAKLEKSSPSVDQYENILANVLQAIGCDAQGAPYVIRALLDRTFGRFVSGSPHSGRLAASFLDETQCQGARGLSEDEKAQLRQIIRDRASPAPPSPPAAPPNQ